MNCYDPAQKLRHPNGFQDLARRLVPPSPPHGHGGKVFLMRENVYIAGRPTGADDGTT